jgi:hypothetical protein
MPALKTPVVDFCSLRSLWAAAGFFVVVNEADTKLPLALKNFSTLIIS